MKIHWPSSPWTISATVLNLVGTQLDGSLITNGHSGPFAGLFVLAETNGTDESFFWFLISANGAEATLKVMLNIIAVR